MLEASILSQQAAAIRVFGGGGGPMSPILWSADFLNQTYTLEGSSCNVSDILIEDAVNWGVFNAATDIGPEGMTATQPVLAPNVVGSTPNQFVFVMQFTVDTYIYGHGAQVNITDIPNFTRQVVMNLTTGFVSDDWIRLQLDSGGDGFVNSATFTAVGTHRIALLISTTRLAASIDGGTVIGVNGDFTSFAPNTIAFDINDMYDFETMISYSDKTEADLVALATL